MKIHEFNTEENRKFWEANTADYQGAKNAKWILFLCRDHIKGRSKSILDAGAGDGSLLREFASQFPGVSMRGIDLAPAAPEIEQGDLKDIQADDNTYDTIFCSEVIEHVSHQDALDIIKEIHRVLAPGGIFILTTPFAEKLDDARVACPKCDCIFHRYGHQQYFFEKDHISLIEEAGLTSLDSFPVKLSKVRALKFLGGRFFRSEFSKSKMRKMRGKRMLISISKKGG